MGDFDGGARKQRRGKSRENFGPTWFEEIKFFGSQRWIVHGWFCRLTETIAAPPSFFSLPDLMIQQQRPPLLLTFSPAEIPNFSSSPSSSSFRNTDDKTTPSVGCLSVRENPRQNPSICPPPPLPKKTESLFSPDTFLNNPLLFCSVYFQEQGRAAAAA